MKYIFLSDQFYEEYKDCEEILQKRERPYVCLEVMIYGKKFALPLRHHISHTHCFRTYGDGGIDYTKAIPIINANYVSQTIARVDSKTHNIIKSKRKTIEREFKKFIDFYMMAMKYSNKVEYQNILNMSSLKYFIK